VLVVDDQLRGQDLPVVHGPSQELPALGRRLDVLVSILGSVRLQDRR
jgi:hypothetical protein